jgi:hypothetical protein
MTALKKVQGWSKPKYGPEVAIDLTRRPAYAVGSYEAGEM